LTILNTIYKIKSHLHALQSIAHPEKVMPSTKTKAKTKTTSARQAKDLSFDDTLADEWNDLTKKITAANKKVAKLKEQLKSVTEQISESYTPDKALAKATIVGDNSVVTIGAEGTKRSVTNKDKLIDALEAIDEGLPMKLANFTLKDIDAYIAAAPQKKFIKTEYTGVRKITGKLN